MGGWLMTLPELQNQALQLSMGARFAVVQLIRFFALMEWIGWRVGNWVFVEVRGVGDRVKFG